MNFCLVINVYKIIVWLLNFIYTTKFNKTNNFQTIVKDYIIEGPQFLEKNWNNNGQEILKPLSFTMVPLVLVGTMFISHPKKTVIFHNSGVN